MSIIIKAHLTDGRVLRCDHECHDSINPHRPSICFGRFNGLSYEQAILELPTAAGFILTDAYRTIPNLRMLEFHYQICTYLIKPDRSLDSTRQAILDRIRSTRANGTAPSGSSRHHH